jgi:hypothetical protein
MIGYGIVKGIPRLILLVLALFFGLFLWCFGIGYLYSVVFTSVHVPQGFLYLQEMVQSYFWIILVITLYSTAILGTNYAVRKHIITILRVPLLLILISGLAIASVFLFERISPMVPAQQSISSNLELKTGTILISGNQKELILRPGKEPIVVQALLPKQSGIISSIIQEGQALGSYFESFWIKGYLNFTIFIGLILYFLTSLGPVFSISGWPLANLLLGLLVARFALWIQVFLFSEPVVHIVSVITGSLLPEPIQPFTALVPLFLLGTLIHLFALLLYLSKDKKNAHR